MNLQNICIIYQKLMNIKQFQLKLYKCIVIISLMNIKFWMIGSLKIKNSRMNKLNRVLLKFLDLYLNTQSFVFQII